MKYVILIFRQNFAYIEEQNIHGVIYNSAFKDLDFMDSVEAATDIWECLRNCLNFYKELSSFKVINIFIYILFEILI